MRGNFQIVRGNRNWNATVNGTTADMFAIREWPLKAGRLFSERDRQAAERVALLGATVARELFADADPVARFYDDLAGFYHLLFDDWDAAVERFGDEVPRQDEVIQLLGQLHAADVLQFEVSPDVDEMLRRSQRMTRRSRLAKWLSPLAVRIPLFDPDRVLERWLPWYGALFGAARDAEAHMERLTAERRRIDAALHEANSDLERKIAARTLAEKRRARSA